MNEDEELAHLKATGERLTETFKSLRKEFEDFKKKRPRVGSSIPLRNRKNIEVAIAFLVDDIERMLGPDDEYDIHVRRSIIKSDEPRWVVEWTKVEYP